MSKFLILFMLVSGSVIFSCQSQTQPVMGPQEYSKAITDTSALLVDVRTPEEFGRGHLKNAVLVDVLEDSFDKEISKLDHNKTVYVYCRSGSRSADAQERMYKMGFKNVINLKGGIQAWQEAGYPVEK